MPPLGRRRWTSPTSSAKYGEELIKGALLLCALCLFSPHLGLSTYWFPKASCSSTRFSLGFPDRNKWTPIIEPQSFGVLPLLAGTVQVAVGAGIIAIPLGLGCALFLSEYASRGVRDVLKPILEILAGIPTVVYGYFAITSVTPLLSKIFPQTEVFNAASAAIVVGIMILPMIASLCDDALRSVPSGVRFAGYSLGATKFEVSTRVVVPGAASGIFASFVLALSRAIGETMAVTLAAGANPTLTLNPLESIQTMTAFMVQISMGDVVADSLEYQTIFAVGLLLFVITLTMNLSAFWVVRRFRKYKSD
ncbi:MAG: phosphate ABC transporter permease subunit PstC [Bdellovibrionota bacterium]